MLRNIKRVLKFNRVKEKFNPLYKVIKNATIDTIQQDGVEHSGYIAFLCLLSFFPAVIFGVAIAGLVGQSQLGTKAIHSFLSNVPTDISSTIEPIINEVLSGPSFGILSVAFIGIIWTASSAIEGVRTILNRAYRVESPPAYILRRLLSILHFFIFIILIMTTVFVFILLPIIWRELNELFGNSHDTNLNILYLRQTAVFLVLFFTVSVFYYIIPNVRLKFSVVMPGAFLVVIGWIITGKAFTLYLANFNQLNIIYGSLGGIVVSLLFFYIMSMIFVWGAEFNYHFNKSIINKNFLGIK
ncbi:YihY/virulence factor BrkB family protein [Pseudomonadota bacterium]